MRKSNKTWIIILLAAIELISIIFVWQRYHVNDLYQKSIPGNELIMVSENIGAYYDENGYCF